MLTYLFNQWSWLSHQSVLRRWSVTQSDGGIAGADLCTSTIRFIIAFMENCCAICGLGDFYTHLVPLSMALFDEAMACSQFQVLSSFETASELDRWKGGALINRMQMDSEKQDFQLQIKLTNARFSGTGLQYFPGDWSEYTYMNLRFYQPLKEPLKLTIRIHDVFTTINIMTASTAAMSLGRAGVRSVLH